MRTVIVPPGSDTEDEVSEDRQDQSHRTEGSNEVNEAVVRDVRRKVKGAADQGYVHQPIREEGKDLGEVHMQVGPT